MRPQGIAAKPPDDRFLLVLCSHEPMIDDIGRVRGFVDNITRTSIRIKRTNGYWKCQRSRTHLNKAQRKIKQILKIYHCVGMIIDGNLTMGNQY